MSLHLSIIPVVKVHLQTKAKKTKLNVLLINRAPPP